MRLDVNNQSGGGGYGLDRDNSKVAAAFGTSMARWPEEALIRSAMREAGR